MVRIQIRIAKHVEQFAFVYCCILFDNYRHILRDARTTEHKIIRICVTEKSLNKQRINKIFKCEKEVTVKSIRQSPRTSQWKGKDRRPSTDVLTSLWQHTADCPRTQHLLKSKLNLARTLLLKCLLIVFRYLNRFNDFLGRNYPFWAMKVSRVYRFVTGVLLNRQTY